MRVIAGKYRSRPLRSLRGDDIRPTADKLRQSLFNILTAGNPEALANTVWLDLFAGTGAIGIEALSRGAEMIYFVESSAQAAALIEQNLASLKIEKNFRIVKQDVMRGVRTIVSAQPIIDFVFLDPPYQMHDAYSQTFKTLEQSNLLKPEAMVIAEHEKRFDPGVVCEGFTRFRRLEQGDAALSFYRKKL